MKFPLCNRSIIISIGFTFYGLLMILAIVFFRERVIMPDTGFQLFELLRHHDFAIQVGRYGAVMSQVFPLLAARMGWSLQGILLAYSLSFVILSLIVFSVNHFFFGKSQLGLVVLLFSSLLMVHTFFWVQSELIQSCLLILLLWGGILNLKRPLSWHWIWLLPLLVIALITHPLAIIPHVFIGVFFLTDRTIFNSQAVWQFTILGLLLVVGKLIFLPTGLYDATSYGLSENAFFRFYRFFSWRSTHLFIRYCFDNYLLFLPLVIWIIYSYRKKGQNRKLLLFSSFTLGYLVLVNGTFFWGGVQFHLEAFYQVLAIFIAFPLVFDVFPNQTKRVMVGIVLLVLSHCLLQIVRVGQQYQDRTDWITQLIEQNRKANRHKIVLQPEELPLDTLILEWGLPYEAALLSSLQQTDITFSLAIDLPDARIDQHLDKKRAFVHTFGQIPYVQLNQLPYFQFRDTSWYEKVSLKQR